MNTVEPINNKVRITPYSQRLLQFGINDSKLYFSKATNSLLQTQTLGYKYMEDEDPYESVAITKKYDDRIDCILNGLQTSFSMSGNIINVTVDSGSLICDSTLLIFPEQSVLDFDLDPVEFDGVGFLVLVVFFKWIESISENKPFLRLCHVSSDGNTVNPIAIPWDITNHRLVITKFTYDKNVNDVINVVNHVPDPFLCSRKQFVLIKNYSYELGALPVQWYDVFRQMRNFFGFRLVKIISGTSSWVQDVPPFNVPDTTNYYYSSINISEINKKDCIIQCYIDDMKVEPAATQHISNEELKIWFPGHFVNQTVLPDVKVIIMG